MPPTLPTRDRLINSARYLFWERGYAGTSMADLLAHAEVNSGSFYHFFESKEALLREVLSGYLRALRPMVVDPAFAQTDEPVERIFAILAGYRGRILQTDCKYGCPLGRLALEIDPENRSAHKLIAQNFQGWITAVRECIDQIKHCLPKGTDPVGQTVSFNNVPFEIVGLQEHRGANGTFDQDDVIYAPISTVIANGRVFDRVALNQLLNKVESTLKR